MGKLVTFIIAVLVFSIVIAGLNYVITTEFDYYGKEIEPEYADIFNDSTSSINDMDVLVKKIQNETQKEEGISTTFSFIMAGSLIFKAIRLPFEAIGIATNLINGIAIAIGIPSIIIAGILSIIMVVVTFLVLKAILRTDL